MKPETWIAKRTEGGPAPEGPADVCRGVRASLHNEPLCKADPGGLPPGGGRGRGVARAASDKRRLSDGEAASTVTEPARDGRDWRGACLA